MEGFCVKPGLSQGYETLNKEQHEIEIELQYQDMVVPSVM